MNALTRGPLPARVYWGRRLLLLGMVFLLVFGIAQVLTRGSDASSEPGRAVQVAAEPEPTAPVVPDESGTGDTQKPRQPRTDQRDEEKGDKGNGKLHQEPVLADPEGTCLDEDVAVTPGVKRAEAGSDVLIVLALRTIEAEACTWRVSPESLTLKITSGRDDIWSSRECPRAVPTRNVVVRSAVTTKVGVRWNGKRSDEECSNLTEWALPGWYHVAAAALAGEPSDVQFELGLARAEHVTETVEPEPRDEGDGKKKDGDKPRR